MEKDDLCKGKIRALKDKHCLHAGPSSQVKSSRNQSAARSRRTYRIYNSNSSDVEVSEVIDMDTKVDIDSDNYDDIQYGMESRTVHYTSMGRFEFLSH